MIFSDIYKDITSSFGSLWGYKVRGESLEVITPFATTSNKFVSVFITYQNGDFIVSDGGWMHEGAYDNEFDLSIDCYEKLYNHYKNHFSIKDVKSQNGVLYFYKKSKKEISIPSLVFDVSSFISTMVSAAMVEFEAEKVFKERFGTAANNFLEDLFHFNDVKLNAYLDQSRTVKVNAIIKKENNKLALVNYITGSTFNHFNNSISKTHMVFELAQKSQEITLVENKIAIIDVNATGYVPKKISTFLTHFREATDLLDTVRWDERDKIKNILHSNN